MFELGYDIISKNKKRRLKKMTKTLKPRRTSRPEEIQTDIAPQALTNEDMSKLIKNETDADVKTGYFDFKTGKVVLDK